MQQEDIAQGKSRPIPYRTLKVIAVIIMKVIGNILHFGVKTLFKSMLLCVVFLPAIATGTLPHFTMPLFGTVLVLLIAWDTCSIIVNLMFGVDYVKLGPTKDLIERKET